MTNSTQPPPDLSCTQDLFKYTYNEQQRFRERERRFDVTELQRLAAEAVARKVEDILSISKLGEGAGNRAFVIRFRNDFKLVARIPYPVTEPRQQLVANTDTEAVLNAGAEKEIKYLARYGRPLFPFNRMQREIFNLEKQQPSVHVDSLRKYLQISSSLIPEGSRELIRPILRHPDLRPSNIFVSDDYEITSLIDWQSTTALPLFLHTGIPDNLDNSVDPVSRSLETPRMPDGLSASDEDSRLEQLELFHKRHLHYLYITETSKRNRIHYEALTLPFSVGRRKLYDLSSAPWQGDNIPLRSSLMFMRQQWLQIAARPDVPCPIAFAEEEEQACFRLDELEREVAEQLRGSMEMLGLGPEGWVSSDNYEAAKEAIGRMKEMCLEQAETECEKTAIKDHWVYDDMDEDEYL
ncbi:hypothetical protein DV737_g1818, partial [Chaetothyriales sp. CBS 132003]